MQRGSETLGSSRAPAGFIISVTSELPSDVGTLIRASLSGGFGFLRRLEEGWSSGANRFATRGELLLVARNRGALAGISGLNEDPYAGDPGVCRVRHLYVAARFRRRGVGRALVLTVLDRARDHFTLARVRTDTPGGDAFYRALGFSRVSLPDATHERPLAGGPESFAASSGTTSGA